VIELITAHLIVVERSWYDGWRRVFFIHPPGTTSPQSDGGAPASIRRRALWCPNHESNVATWCPQHVELNGGVDYRDDSAKLLDHGAAWSKAALIAPSSNYLDPARLFAWQRRAHVLMPPANSSEGTSSSLAVRPELLTIRVIPYFSGAQCEIRYGGPIHTLFDVENYYALIWSL
jgi:hypothetical protein